MRPPKRTAPPPPYAPESTFRDQVGTGQVRFRPQPRTRQTIQATSGTLRTTTVDLVDNRDTLTSQVEHQASRNTVMYQQPCRRQLFESPSNQVLPVNVMVQIGDAQDSRPRHRIHTSSVSHPASHNQHNTRVSGGGDRHVTASSVNSHSNDRADDRHMATLAAHSNSNRQQLGCNTLGRPRSHRPKLSHDSLGRSHGRRMTGSHVESGVPLPPERRLPGEPLTSPVKLVHRFSVYPEQIACDGNGVHSELSVDVSCVGDIAVVDSQLMVVHIFSRQGEVLHPAFRVVGVCGGCFVGGDQLVLATNRGIRICRINGLESRDLAVGHVLSTKSYGVGFVAVQPRSLLIYRTCLSVAPANTVTKVRRQGFFKRSKSFVKLTDAAVTPRRMLAVFDIGKYSVYIIDDSGTLMSKVILSAELSGRISTPTHFIIDRGNNFLFSDTTSKRLLQYQSTGKFMACLLDFSVQLRGIDVDGTPSTYGVAVAPSEQVVIAICGSATTEIRIYKI